MSIATRAKPKNAKQSKKVRKVTRPPLTYAIIEVPNGRVISRGNTLEAAIGIMEIHNEDRDQLVRVAVIPDADLIRFQMVPHDVKAPPTGENFPKFPILVYDRDTNSHSVVEVPDPRVEWCRRYNEANEATGHAVPLFVWADFEVFGDEPNDLVNVAEIDVNESNGTFGGGENSPALFAIVELETNRVVMRGMGAIKAKGFARQWGKRHGKIGIIPECLAWQTDDQIIAQLATKGGAS